MNGKLICQILIITILVGTLFRNLYSDIHGIRSRDAGGFRGVVISIFVFVLMVLVYYKAGLFPDLISGQ